MFRQVLGRVVLAAALLAGWQSSLVHPLEHTDGNGGFVHLTDGHGHDKKSSASELCDSLAALSAVAAGAARPVVADAAGQIVLSRYSSDSRAAEAPPFLSQGPPKYL
jgi:hypothetical protein